MEVKCYLIVVLIYISSMDNNIEDFFVCAYWSFLLRVIMSVKTYKLKSYDL